MTNKTSVKTERQIFMTKFTQSMTLLNKVMTNKSISMTNKSVFMTKIINSRTKFRIIMTKV